MQNWEKETPLVQGKLCCTLNGFSLHAKTAIPTTRRDRLYKLIEYIARGPLSNERLDITDDGKVKLKLKSPWRDGTSHLLFTKSEFLEKLTALIPPPKTHLVRWNGCLAPGAKARKHIALKPQEKKGFSFDTDIGKITRNKTWSKMLARVFEVDILKCDCGGKLTPIAAIKDYDSAAT